IHKEQQKHKEKIAERNEKLVFVGYEGMNNYRLWNPITKAIKISRDVIFNEDLDSENKLSFSSTLAASIDLHDLGLQDFARPSLNPNPDSNLQSNSQSNSHSLTIPVSPDEKHNDENNQ